MTSLSAVEVAVVVMLLAPAALLAFLAAASVFFQRLGERAIARATILATSITFAASVIALALYVQSGATASKLTFTWWRSSGDAEFALDLWVDGLSLGLTLLCSGICGVVAAFSSRYLHRDPGYRRYFVLFAMFETGIMLVALAASIEGLFAGWELLGLSSALLVGFFHERPQPIGNALRVFAIYRVSDAAMLSAVVLLHHWAGTGSLSLLFSGHAETASALSVEKQTVIAMLLLAAVIGKSALFPLSSWLPRAMEGPTPSSAVYYGALSVHAGCFLLLRAEPLLAHSRPAQVLTLVVGGATIVFATATARVQTDIKSALALASLGQVGAIVIEIALGFTTIAFVHIVGHACFRLLQLLSAPNILHDLRALENAMGEPQIDVLERAPGKRSWLYLVALERGFVEPLLDRFVVEPFKRLALSLDRVDRWLCGAGAPTGEDRAPQGGLDD